MEWYVQILRERTSFVWPVTCSIPMAIFVSNILLFLVSCVHASGDHVSEGKQLWFGQMLAASLNFCPMCHCQVFCSLRCGWGKVQKSSSWQLKKKEWVNPFTLTLPSVTNQKYVIIYTLCQYFSFFSQNITKDFTSNFTQIRSHLFSLFIS